MSRTWQLLTAPWGPAVTSQLASLSPIASHILLHTLWLQVVMDQVSIARAVVQLQLAAAQPSPQQQQQQQRPQHQTAAQVAVQATAMLRNLALVPTNSAQFVAQQGAALHALVSLLEPFQCDPEVLMNVSRCLSKLSLYDNCRQGLLAIGGAGSPAQRTSSEVTRRAANSGGGGSTNNSSSNSQGAQPTGVAQIVKALLAVQASQPKQWQTGIRLAFALGQLTTYHAEARQLAAAVPGALLALPQLVLDLMQLSTTTTTAAVDTPVEQDAQHIQKQQQQQALAHDFATKVLRVIANLGIDRTIGATLAAKQVSADALVAVLAGGCDFEAAEELVLNATAALTNLAFYDTPSNKVRVPLARVPLQKTA